MRRLSFVLALLGLASLLAAPCARAQAPAILDRFRGRLGLCQTPGQPALLTVSVVGEGSLRLAWGSAAGVETAAQPDCSLTAYELSVAVGGRAAGTTKTFTTTVGGPEGQAAGGNGSGACAPCLPTSAARHRQPPPN